MDRAFASGASATPPSAPGSPSVGYATAGNPGSGIPATRPGPWWFHMVTEELRAVLVAGGITPDQSDVAQLLAAIQALVTNGVTGKVVPVGALVWVAASAAPTGFIKANGALLTRASYVDLWTFAQSSGNVSADDASWRPGGFSPGNGSTTFRIPDLRGLFVRGHHDGSGTYEPDTSRVLGSYQADELKAHTHTWTRKQTVGGTLAGSDNNQVGDGTANTGSTGGAETRPRNVSLLACLRY
jgi:microcystin-dependent protein